MDTARKPLDLCHLIDGRWEPGTGTATQSTDPARPDVAVAKYREAGEDQLERAIRAAARAQREWDQLGLIARGRVLRRAGELLAARAEDVAAADDPRRRARRFPTPGARSARPSRRCTTTAGCARRP